MQNSLSFLGAVLSILGGLAILAGLLLLWFPDRCRAALLAFPRSRWPGWILTAVCVCWVAWEVSQTALGSFEGLKPLVPFAAILLFAVVVYFLDELLSARALGGLLLLLANPVLKGVRWVDSPWRFVAVVLAYAWVILGCSLMLHPWSFRKLTARMTAASGRMRGIGWSKLLAGIILLAAGFWHLR